MHNKQIITNLKGMITRSMCIGCHCTSQMTTLITF